MNNRTRSLLIVLIVAAIILLLDRLSKQWILDNLQLYETHSIIPALAPYLELFHIRNTGVAFGLFQNANTVMMVVASIASVGILAFSYKQENQTWLLSISLGLMLGGAVGNLIDRVLYGSVVDFVLLQIPDVYQFATFNVADSSIVVGTLLLVVLLFLDERRQQALDQPLPDQT
ncbi:MAG: signal peptidase II [Proteobacteria bacterium]|nr:signal peptidase II [Pseudomonadota bacterium]